MFFCFFFIVELQTSHIFPYWKASFSGNLFFFSSSQILTSEPTLE